MWFLSLFWNACRNLQLFVHMMKRRREVHWTFGPITSAVYDLDQIDTNREMNSVLELIVKSPHETVTARGNVSCSHFPDSSFSLVVHRLRSLSTWLLWSKFCARNGYDFDPTFSCGSFLRFWTWSLWSSSSSFRPALMLFSSKWKMILSMEPLRM